MIEIVHECLANTLAERGGQPYEPGRTLLINSTHGVIDGCCYLVFGRNTATPKYIVKSARTEAGKEIYGIEYRNLQLLQREGMNAERANTPEPIGMWERNGMLITAQSALPGKLLANLPSDGVFAADTIDRTLDSLFEWWRRFHGKLGVQRVSVTAEVYEKEVLGLLSRYRARFLPGTAEEGLLDRRLERERRLLDRELPFMALHGDFVAANMMLDPSGISVFDWEFPLVHQLPLFDLFVFFGSFRFPRTEGGEDSHFSRFQSVYWGHGAVSTAVQGRLLATCDEFGLARELLGDLFLLALLRQANMKYDAMLTANGLTEESRATKEDGWQLLHHPDMNTPLARIHDGVYENIRYVADQGLPSFVA